MKRLKEIRKIILDTGSTTIELNTSSEASRIVGTAYIQVSDVSDLEAITIYGKVDRSEYTIQIGAISLTDYKAVTEITDTGIYFLPIDGLNKMILTADGSAEITLKIIED